MRYILIISFLALLACNSEKKQLPIFGERTLKTTQIDGKTLVDTIFATVPYFSFINQNGDSLTQKELNGKIYVADFFFISCPTICPIMKKEMIRVFEAYKGDAQVMLLSHTIDPEHDTIALLRQYANDLGSDGKQWQFLTGAREQIYEMAEKGYYATALPDSTAPGGFVHSGGFILVDKLARVRGIYDGTDPKQVSMLIDDIALLKQE